MISEYAYPMKRQTYIIIRYAYMIGQDMSMANRY